MNCPQTPRIRTDVLMFGFFTNFYQHVILEPLNGKTSFKSHIVELLKSYTIVVESWESIRGNQTVPLFVQATFFVCLRVACMKMFTVELMDISGL